VGRLTSNTPDVIVELLLQSVGGVLLPREVLQMLVEYIVRGSVDLAQILKKLQREKNASSIFESFAFTHQSLA